MRVFRIIFGCGRFRKWSGGIIGIYILKII